MPLFAAKISSTAAADSYVEDSLVNKIDFFSILYNPDGTSTFTTSISVNTNATKTRDITINNCSNITLTFHVSIVINK